MVLSWGNGQCPVKLAAASAELLWAYSRNTQCKSGRTEVFMMGPYCPNTIISFPKLLVTDCVKLLMRMVLVLQSSPCWWIEVAAAPAPAPPAADQAEEEEPFAFAAVTPVLMGGLGATCWFF